MKMILHILRKDLRRQWIEIALYVLVCFLWAWQIAHPFGWAWRGPRDVSPAMLFGLWFFIVVRAVQGECLVGDREFWSTRPYRWPQLMIEKALFLVICLNVPLLLAQIYLLTAADIPLSISLVPGLVFLHLMFAFLLTFPAAVLASVTQNLVQWLLAIAGLLLAAMVISWLPWYSLPATLAQQENVACWFGAALMVPALAFALLWQYARRRALPGRIAILAACAMIPVTILIAHQPLLRAIGYPQAKGQNPLRVAYNDRNTGGKRYYMQNNRIQWSTIVSVPVTIGSADPDMTVAIDGFQVTLNGDNGWRWQSGWINSSQQMSNHLSARSVEFEMATEMVDRFQDVHPTMSVEYAFSTYRLGRVQKIDTSPGQFKIEQQGYCRWWGQDSGTFAISISGLTCEAPLRTAAVIVTQFQSDNNTCKENGEPPLPPGHQATGVEYGTEIYPAEFDPNPAHTFSIPKAVWIPVIDSVRDPSQLRTSDVCRGTPFTVRTGILVDRMRATYELGSIGTAAPPSIEIETEPEPLHFRPGSFD